jgi:hypothetical protein
MLKKHEENWKNKATIVGLSIDDGMDEVVKIIEKKDWKRVNHYRFKTGLYKENPTNKLCEIDGNKVALINK